jgi:tetratricopeptide (TPR) repeat protein
MRKLIFFTCVIFVTFQTTCAQRNAILRRGVIADFIQVDSNEKAGREDMTRINAGQCCTMIYASDTLMALAGNNEDYKNPFGTIWFTPPENGKFGRVYFGWQGDSVRYPQGGMNDRGLFYDGATAENVVVPPGSTKPRYHTNLIFKAMEECSTVDGVLKLFDHYDVSGTWNGHYLIGDRFGNSAIIEPQNFIRKKGSYQIVTNFFQSKTKPENATCSRYRIASEIFAKSEELSIDLFRRILNAVHWEEYSGSMTVTLYSFICDLKKRDIYIYHFHNFEDAVKINLPEELKKGERSQSIVSLFPYETFASQRYHSQRIVDLLYERILQNGLEGDEGAITFFNKLKKGDYRNYHLSAGERHLNTLGYQLLENNKTKEAIEIFTLAVTEFPKSYNVYDSLGEAYMVNGEKDQAIENYKKSLELNPGNENAREMLKNLEKQ